MIEDLHNFGFRSWGYTIALSIDQAASDRISLVCDRWALKSRLGEQSPLLWTGMEVFGIFAIEFLLIVIVRFF